jgi:hypothetical protein
MLICTMSLAICIRHLSTAQFSTDNGGTATQGVPDHRARGDVGARQNLENMQLREDLLAAFIDLIRRMRFFSLVFEALLLRKCSVRMGRQFPHYNVDPHSSD